MTVTVGAYSLIVPDPDEQYIPALSLKPHENFNVTGHLEDDIGLIQVRKHPLHLASKQFCILLREKKERTNECY